MWACAKKATTTFSTRLPFLAGPLPPRWLHADVRDGHLAQRPEYVPELPSLAHEHANALPLSPVFVEAFNVTDNGANLWSYQSTSTGLPTFQVDMARHADAFGKGAIDTVAAEAQFVPPSSCQIFAFSSTTGNGTPAWSISVPNCDSNLLYDDDRFIDISDDGSTVAFSGYVSTGAATTGTLWVFSAQTGVLRFTKTLDPKTAPGGPVQLSENGTWVAWSTGVSVLVLDGACTDDAPLHLLPLSRTDPPPTNTQA